MSSITNWKITKPSLVLQSGSASASPAGKPGVFTQWKKSFTLAVCYRPVWKTDFTLMIYKVLLDNP